MEQLQNNIDIKNDNIVREITPRIEQLEQKIEAAWNNIQSMDKTSEE